MTREPVRAEQRDSAHPREAISAPHRFLEAKVTDQPFIRIKLTADGQARFTAMFEPSGATYQLAGDEHMFADVVEPFSSELEIVNWLGGISRLGPRTVITRDADGSELHRLN
jgi:hypothetical protein